MDYSPPQYLDLINTLLNRIEVKEGKAEKSGWQGKEGERRKHREEESAILEPSSERENGGH